MNRTIPRLGKERSAAALDFNHKDEDTTETVDPDTLGGPEGQIQMRDRGNTTLLSLIMTSASLSAPPFHWGLAPHIDFPYQFVP
jgi:hypothetical protein